MQSGMEPPPGQWLEVARTVTPDLKVLSDAASDLGLELTLELHKSMPLATGQQAADLMALACALRETGYRRAAVIELEYENARAEVVRPDLRRAKELLSRDFVLA